MAGIGFELKKIYRKDGISRALMGAGYSTLVTIGPTLVIIGVITVLSLVLGVSRVPFAERELLSTTILWVFIFSVTMTAPFNSLFSRYLADKFYQEEFDDILPSFYVGVTIVGVVSLIMALPVMWSLYYRGHVDLPFILAAYVLWASAVLIFFTNTYLQATKDYKIIALFFFIGMAVAGILALVLWYFGISDTIHSMIYGLAVGFFVIAFTQFSYVRRYFRGRGGRYSDCLGYFRLHFPIFATNLFYTLGLYVHNFVFWTTPSRMVVAETYVCNQPYDMATCLAMFTNVSTMVLFTVIAETRFHDAYQNYMQAIIGASYSQIQLYKRTTFRKLSQQIIQIFGIQIAITSVFFMVVMLLGRQFFAGMTSEIYPVLAVSYLGIFMMYGNIVYLYYFEDRAGALLTALIYFLCTLLGSWWSKGLTVQFYGLGAFLGMLAGWTFSFFRIRYVERNIEALIYCRHKIIDTMRSSAKGEIVYRKS